MGGGDRLIEDFLTGRYRILETGKPATCPIKSVVIKPSLEGSEAELVRTCGLTGRLGVVADENTHDVLGKRVVQALPDAEAIVLDHPHADEATAADLAERSRHLDGLVAVGSGTINDLCKYVTFQQGRACAVFGTAPSMNGYTTSTVSIAKDGYKNSLQAQAPVGCFFDLGVLAAAPRRMIRAGIGDAGCRSTAQVDWLFSHLLLGSEYSETPFDMQLADERPFLRSTFGAVNGDLDAVAALVRILVLGGLGVIVTGTSHSGSMGEHGISHYVDMFARPHPGSLHGEQVGVASATMARLQDLLLTEELPPRLRAYPFDEASARRRYGDRYEDCMQGFARKAMDEERIAVLNDRLMSHWTGFRKALLAVRLPFEHLREAFAAADVAMDPASIGIDPAFYGEAVAHAHEIRDRYSFLDLAAQTGRLSAFAALEAER